MKAIKINEGDFNILKIKKLFYREIKSLEKGVYHPTSKHFYNVIINNIDFILKTSTIPISLIEEESKIKTFIQQNNIRVEEIDKKYYLNKKDSKFIIDSLKTYLNKPMIEVINSFDYSYVDVEEFDIDDERYNKHILHKSDIIKPSPSTEFIKSILRNLFYNNNITFAFNDNIEWDNSYSHTTIKTNGFKIIAPNGLTSIPTRFKHICLAKNKDGVECGNIAEFFKGHLNSELKCNISNNSKTGHSIKNLSTIPAIAIKQMFRYFIEDSLTGREFNAYSFIKLPNNKIIANYLYVCDNDKDVIIITNYKNELEVNNDIGILTTPSSPFFFLFDVLEDIKQYYKQHHNFKINNNNKIVGLFILSQLCIKQLLNERFHGMYVGESGGGKSIWAKLLTPLFTNNFADVKAKSLSEARFLGSSNRGDSGMFINNRFTPGLMESCDVIIMDEATDVLNDRVVFKSTNDVYEWMKVADEGKDRGKVGTRSGKPNACVVMFGNISQMEELNREYYKKVNYKYKQYKTEGRKKDLTLIPLYKSCEFYFKEYEDDSLAKAHSVVRKNDYRHKNYIIKLDEASMARFTLFVGLEDERTKYEDYDVNIPLDDIYGVRGDVFMKELVERCADSEGEVKKPNKQFCEDVGLFMNNYLKNERNNFNFVRGGKMNNHVVRNLVRYVIDLLWINKLYYKQPYNLTKDDENVVRYLLKFNYNVLSNYESNLSKHPYINDSLYSLDEIGKYDDEMGYNYKVKLKADALKRKEKEKEEGDITIKDGRVEDKGVSKGKEEDDDEDIFDDNLPEDEFNI